MKKVAHGILIAVACFLIAASAVRAQDDASARPAPRSFLERATNAIRNIAKTRQATRAAERSERKEDRNEQRQDKQASRSAKQAKVKENIEEKRQEVRAHVAEVHAERLKHRFSVYVKRLASIIERLQSRIDILKTNGKDTTAAQAKLNEATSALTQAKTKADSAVATFASIDPDQYEEQRALALQASDIAKEAREDFQEVLTALREVVQLLKAV